MVPKLTKQDKSVLDSEPYFDFRYLELVSGKGFYDLAKRRKNRKIFKELEHFLYKSVQENNDLEKIITSYTSHNSSKIYAKDNNYIRNVFTSLDNNCKDCDKRVKAYLDKMKNTDKSLTHIHLRKGGKGECVLFGFTYDKTFYVVAIDPEHEFDKK